MDRSLRHVTLCNMAFPAVAHAPLTLGFNSIDTVFPEFEECTMLIRQRVCPLKAKPPWNLLPGILQGTLMDLWLNENGRLTIPAKPFLISKNK